MAKGNGQKQTAAQRIEGLENALAGTQRNTQILAGEIDNLRQTIGALARRLNAAIKSGETGTLSNDSVNEIITQENILDLKGKVDLLVKEGVLQSSTKEINQMSFVVGRELDEEKNVINPRIQFAVKSVVPEMVNLLLGKRVGDVVTNEKGDGLLLEVTEVFDIVEQGAEKEAKKAKKAPKQKAPKKEAPQAEASE